MTTLYEAVGGLDAIVRLASAWHERAVADPVVAHAFSGGFHPDHAARLAAYWAQAWGGPDLYTTQYGTETDVVRMHSGNGQHDAMNERAIGCFDRAMSDVGILDGPVRSALHDYWAWMTVGPMYAYHDSADDVPDGLQITHWGLGGRIWD